MANQTTIGELVIDLQIKTNALEKGLETAKERLKEIEKQSEKVQRNNSQLELSYSKLSTKAIEALSSIKSAIGDGIENYKKYESANKGLESIIKGQGLSFDKAQSFIEDYISDGLIPLSDATLAYKNLASRGYNEEQIKQTMIALKDAAAFGRQSTYEYGEAIATATEGLKNENSVLVDNAGVTKNVAKMWEDYAKSIGKTTASLTQEEKIQAEVLGIQEESKNQIGDATKYSETFAGQQAQINAVNIELSKTIGESMIPALTQYSSLQLTLTKGITEFIKNNKTASSGVITLGAGLLATVVIVTKVRTSLLSYANATGVANTVTKTFTASLMANPLFWGGLAITAGIAALNIFISKQQESIDKFNEATEKSENLSEALKNTMNNEGIMSEADQKTIESARDEAQQIIKIYDEKKSKIEQIENEIKEVQKSDKYSFQKNGEINALNVQLEKAKKELSDYEKEQDKYGQTIEGTKNKLRVLNKALELNATKQEYARLTNQKAHRETLINIAQTKADIQGKQQLLNILKQGKTSTEEYANAKSQLVKSYAELAKVNENTIASTQSAIDAENAAADAEWANAQVAIQASILEVSAMMSNSEQIIKIASVTKQSVEEVTASLQNQLNILGNLANLTPEDFKGSVTSNYTPKKVSSEGSKGGGSSSYSNKALDDYKKQIEHKKALDQISLQEEINMYQYALKKYAKTQDEKWELTEKIYSLQKEIQEKSLDDYTAVIEHRKNLDQISLQEEINMYQYAYNALAKTTEQKQELEEKLYELRKELAQKNKELLDQQTTDYERYIQNQKNLRGAEYDTKEQEEDLNKIINLHRSYLNQIMKDERLSLDERKELYQEELDTIRDYEQQKRDLRVQSVDDTVSQLTSAITKQLEEMEEADKKAIEENIKLVEEWKEVRINAINEEYETRIEAIQKELDLLDKSEEEKTRAEEDAEFERKRNRLQQLVDFEHDATTKANYQKELDKLIADYQKTLDKRALQDKKDALKEQQDLLKEEQDNKVQAIEDEAEKKKEQYDKQLDELEEYYEKQKELAQETAEKMLLNVEQNQNEILKLLNSYGNAYEITGQTLGEKLAQGINNGIADKIQNIIQKVQDTIDAGIENKIKEWTAGMYKYEAKGVGNTIINKTVNVEQNNTITTPVDSPSVAYKKQETLNRNLANEIAYVF